ncbi:hypothetical protein [Xanthomonas arboricola]|uniref:hypothetical protein n=1 Tax=Xanthomonas arboricola TaxID=56448 RepID=UPI000F8D2D7F|nr:hypothetical protein [Xanthomonas arboricola]
MINHHSTPSIISMAVPEMRGSTAKTPVLPMHAPAMAMPGEQSRHQHPLVFCCAASWLRACIGAHLPDHPERCIAAARQLCRCCCHATSRANAPAL